MKRRIIGIFSSIGDAKNALGQIKKESWNQTELTVIIQDKNENRNPEDKTHMEIATENFLENQGAGSGPNILWPGLKEEQLSGIGTVKIGYSSPNRKHGIVLASQNLSEAELDFIGQKLVAQKVVVLIEVEDQFLPKLRFIMATNGAEFQNENI